MVEPGDAPALADALGDVIADSAARRRMAHAARERAEQGHGLDRLSARLSSIARCYAAARDGHDPAAAGSGGWSDDECSYE